MCSQECCQAADHLMECKMHQESGAFKMNISFEAIEPYYAAILPLRMLSLKKQDPKSWQELVDLMSHLEEWKKSEFWIQDHALATSFILDNFQTDDWQLDQEMVYRMFGIAYVNDFLAMLNNVKVRLSCPKLSMMSHDCTPNVIRFTDQSKTIRCYASRPIAKGDKLSHTYCDLFLPGAIRRKLLLQTKHFDCQCLKCLDPLELGTYGSSMKCAQCPIFVHPPSWSCSQCGVSLNGQRVLTEVYRESEELLAAKPRSIKDFESFVSKYEKILHPTNFLLIRIKYSLIGFYGRLEGYELQDLVANPALLERKKQLGHQVLEVLKLSEPGLSSAKGVVHYELHVPYFIDANLNKNSKSLDIVNYYLQESVRHLKYKNQNSFGYSLLVSALQTLVQLKRMKGA